MKQSQLIRQLKELVQKESARIPYAVQRLVDRLDHRKAAEAKPGPFAIGDVVKHQTGSPELTVVDFGQHTGRVIVEWPGVGRELKAATFPAACLVLVRSVGTG